MPNDDRTRILISFAMANHGANFAHWLRDKLMKKYNLYSAASVYVDSVYARSGATRHSTGFDSTPAGEGVASVSPDRRPHMLSPTGAVPIGARRDDWNTLFSEAMDEAEVMLFVFTPEFQESEWCLKEWTQFLRQNAKRRSGGKLRGIVLELEGKPGLVSISEPTVTRLKVSKLDGGGRGLAWDKGDFILSESDLGKLYAAIGPLQ